MAYRLSKDRIPVEVEGLTIEVQPITSNTVYRHAVGLGSAYFAASDPAAIQAAFDDLAAYFCIEGQPTWDVVDHRGIVPATPAGMRRFSDTLALSLMSEWVAEFVAEPATTAVDELIPEGPLRDDLNRRLKAVA